MILKELTPPLLCCDVVLSLRSWEKKNWFFPLLESAHKLARPAHCLNSTGELAPELWVGMCYVPEHEYRRTDLLLVYIEAEWACE